MEHGSSNQVLTAKSAISQSYAVTMTVLLGVVSVLLVVLRLEDLLSANMVAANILLLSVLVAGLSGSIRYSWFTGAVEASIKELTYLVAIGPTVCSCLIGALLGEMALSWFPVFLVCLVLATTEITSWTLMVPCLINIKSADSDNLPVVSATQVEKISEEVLPSPTLETFEDEPNLPEEEPTWRFDEPSEPAPHILPQNTFQQITRSNEEGTEVVHGQMRAWFEPEQRHESLHVSFCPPLEGKPEIEIMQLEGPEVSVKPAVVEPHGARFDIQRSGETNSTASVVLEFYAANAVSNSS